MKLITELIEFALQHGMLNETHKWKLQTDGFYTFFEEDDCSCEYESETYLERCEREERERLEEEQTQRENELDRTYYGEFYNPGKHYGKRHHGGGGKSRKYKKTELELPDLEKRVQTAFKKWNKSLEPLVLTVSFLTNHGMDAQGRDLSTWQNASNWLFEVKEQKLFAVVNRLDVTNMFKLTQLCSRLTWHKMRELLVEPIRQCKGECVTAFKELIRGANEPLSENAEIMAQNELFAQVYRVSTGWSKIC